MYAYFENKQDLSNINNLVDTVIIICYAMTDDLCCFLKEHRHVYLLSVVLIYKHLKSKQSSVFCS